MKIGKKGYLIKLVLGYNLNGFDPMEVEIIEEKAPLRNIAIRWQQIGAIKVA